MRKKIFVGCCSPSGGEDEEVEESVVATEDDMAAIIVCRRGSFEFWKLGIMRGGISFSGEQKEIQTRFLHKHRTGDY